jgi:hypothetical protein
LHLRGIDFLDVPLEVVRDEFRNDELEHRAEVTPGRIVVRWS